MLKPLLNSVSRFPLSYDESLSDIQQGCSELFALAASYAYYRSVEIWEAEEYGYSEEWSNGLSEKILSFILTPEIGTRIREGKVFLDFISSQVTVLLSKKEIMFLWKTHEFAISYWYHHNVIFSKYVD